MLRIRTLGGLSVHLADGRRPATSATQPRRLAVLALVARAGSRGITRERLMALLWPDADDEAGRKGISQALYGLRTGLDADTLFLGMQELRLDPEVATCDAVEFEAALAEGAWERAAALYEGPFLDGFFVPNAPEFGRWADEQRIALAHEHSELLERLARRASESGDAAAAVRWWRKRASADPLDPRIALALMRALDESGDRAGAIRHAGIYQALIDEELGTEPDRSVVAFADALRAAPAAPAAPPVVVATPASTVAPAAAVVLEEPPAPPPPPAAPPPVGGGHKPRLTQAITVRVPRRVAKVAMLAIALAAVATWAFVRTNAAALSQGHVLAVGRIVDYREGSARAAGAVVDLLATDLARVAGLQVLSNARMMELDAQLGGDGARDLTAAAARAGGATELLEGALQRRPDGLLQLDLRRVAVSGGRVLAAYRVAGRDVFALVRDATDSLAAGARVAAAASRGPATRSPVAYGFYEEGLRAFARGDMGEARRLFGLAIGVDSAFAMAALYYVQASGALEQSVPPRILEQLADRAREGSERERLLLRASQALYVTSPAVAAAADSLARRYPAEVDGPFLRGFARMADARFADAIPDLRRVIAMDSLSFRGSAARCRACDAMQLLVTAHLGLDSLDAAERLAREWVARQPRSARAHGELASILGAANRVDESIAEWRVVTSLGTFSRYDAVFPGAMRVRAGDVAGGEATARAILRDGASPDEDVATELLVIALRYQGRWREATAVVRAWDARRGRTGPSLLEGQILLERGRFAEAWTALHGAMAARAARGDPPYAVPWALAAGAAASLRDPARAAAAWDSARATAARIDTRVARSTAEHARAMLLLARGDTAGAITVLEGALYAPTLGFTRTNYELARLYLARRRPADALRVTTAALHAALNGPGSYVTMTELHLVAARALDALGRRPEAAVHRRWAEGALRNADPEGAALRAEAAATRGA